MTCLLSAAQFKMGLRSWLHRRPIDGATIRGIPLAGHHHAVPMSLITTTCVQATTDMAVTFRKVEG